MDRRQLPAVVFLTMSTATMCIGARPAHAAAAMFGHGARAGRPGAVREVRGSWEHNSKIAVQMSLDILRPQADSASDMHPAVAVIPSGRPD